MSGTNPGEVILRETLWEPRFNTGWFCLAWAASGLAILPSAQMVADSFERWALLTLAAFALLSSLFGLWYFFSARMDLDLEGFTFRRCGKTWRRAWTTCQHIGAANVRDGECLVINYKSNVERMSSLGRNLTTEDRLDVSFGMGARRLAYLMDRYRAHVEMTRAR